MKKTLISIIYFLGYMFSIQAQTLYTTVNGGGDGGGTIIRFMPATSDLTVVRSFKSNDPTNGGSPTGSLVLASNGKLYGMTQFGGSTNQGVIFSFDPASGNYIKLHDFDGTNGANPSGSLIKASDGLLYGMTQDGDPNGVIFSFDPLSSTFTKLKTFDFINGDEPLGSLMQASNGKLYGITYNGGSFHEGIIFSFDPLTGTYAKLHDFDFDNDGGGPFGNLMQATDGKLYGMTQSGGLNGFGVIFSYDPLASTFTKLKDFDFTNGGDPQGSFLQLSDGKLYAMTRNGGDTGGDGVIFSYDPSSSTYTVLKRFDNINGARPDGYFLQASDGKLYGTTEQGGTNGVGVIFSFDASTSTYTRLQDFNNTNGANAYIGSAFIEVAVALPVTLISFTGKNSGNSNELFWKVDNEQNLNYYELQRSIDGQNFKDVSHIKASGNNSYTYNDAITAALSSIYYYRLKSVDKDGNFKYSAVLKITTDRNGFIVVNPNPFKDRLVVNVESLIQEKATFIVTDISGRQLVKINKLLSAGTNITEIHETGRLSKGTYFLTIIKSQQTQTIKVVKGD